jgi:hypothetical protein
VRAAELAGNTGSQDVATDQTDRDLLAALSGRDAGRERAVAENTRRVVMASAGVIRDRRAGRERSRSLALASILLVVLALGPFVWRVADDLIGGEHWTDIATQTSLWVCVVCPALLAAALIAGWSRMQQ